MTWINAGGPTTGPADHTDTLPLAECRARLEAYTASTSVYGSATERGLHEIARGFAAEVERLKAIVGRVTDVTSAHDGLTGLVPVSELDNALGVGEGEWAMPAAADRYEREQPVREKVATEVWRAGMPTFQPGEDPNVAARTVRAIDARIAEHGDSADWARPAPAVPAPGPQDTDRGEGER